MTVYKELVTFCLKISGFAANGRGWEVGGLSFLQYEGMKVMLAKCTLWGRVGLVSVGDITLYQCGSKKVKARNMTQRPKWHELMLVSLA